MQNFQTPSPEVVAVSDVQTASWQSSVGAVGSVVAVAGIEVSNELAGKVMVIHFESGQAIEQGQLILELDLATDKAEFKGLKAAKKLAQIQFNRSVKLLNDRYTSKSDYDENKAKLDEAKAALIAKQTVIDKKQIRAPFSGALGIRQVDIGEYLAEGSPIVSLQQLDPIYADFTLPERYLSELAKGQKILVTVQAYPEQLFTGKIAAINPGIDQETRTVKLRATLTNKDQTLRPGMFADIQVQTDRPQSIVTIPDTAVTYNPYGSSVFVVSKSDQGLIVNSRQIETGEVRKGRVAVIKGLKAGERVVSAGQVKLRNKMLVTIDDKAAPSERETTMSHP
ncbi:MAG: efflux RND transporter periplasmic adaptor subunit [Methylococcaceae bacterium]